MVSGSLALLYFSFQMRLYCFFGGSRAAALTVDKFLENRVIIRPFVCLSIHHFVTLFPPTSYIRARPGLAGWASGLAGWASDVVGWASALVG